MSRVDIGALPIFLSHPDISPFPMRTFSLATDDRNAVFTALQRPTHDLARYREIARPIIDAVRSRGDDALLEYTEQFDDVRLTSLRVPQAERDAASARIPKTLRDAIETAIKNVTAFHRENITEHTIDVGVGVRCWRAIRPLDSAGLYVPGGTAPLVSTAIMLAIPALLAGVGKPVMCTPPQKDGAVAPSILYACERIGITDIYRVGGAQAIAAMGYGTQTIPKVCKIAGPGNAYVTAAKAEVGSDPNGAAIDMLAGPSELLIIADATADPRFVAADLLSQAEHDRSSQVVLLSTDAALIDAVQRAGEEQLHNLPRKDIAKVALAASVAVLTPSLEDAIMLANVYAPEHLSIQTQNPQSLLPQITNAGSIFLGSFSPETIGDYCSGTNHVLPTSGLARTTGGVSVRTFQKTLTIQELSLDGLRSLSTTATALARAEGLEAHARAVEVRLASV